MSEGGLLLSFFEMVRVLHCLALCMALLLVPLSSRADGGVDGGADGATDGPAHDGSADLAPIDAGALDAADAALTDAALTDLGPADLFNPDLSNLSPTEFVGHHGLVVALDHAEGDTLYVYDLTSRELRRLSDEIGCKGPKISSDGTRVVYHRGGMLHLRALAGGPAEPLVAGYNGHFWLDGAGEEWVYYTTIGDDPSDIWRRLLWPQSQGITTRRRRLRDGRDEHVLDWKGSGGPSPDGTHIASGYATVAIFDGAGQPHFLNGGEQGCNTSLSPDDRYLMMFFPELGHHRIAIVDKNDLLRWELFPPFGVVRWENPDWSNHPRVAAVSGVAGHGYGSVYLIGLPEALDGSLSEPRDLLLLLDARKGSHDWREPTLWIDWQRPPIEYPAVDGGASSDLEQSSGRDVGLDGGGDAGSEGEPSEGDSNADGCGLGGRTAKGGGLVLFLLVAALAWRRRR